MSFTIKVSMTDMSNCQMYTPLVDSNGIKFMLFPKDVMANRFIKPGKECHWCLKKLNEMEQNEYDANTGNSVQWDTECVYASCDKCMVTMCEICTGPCNDVCGNCGRVCHAYPCSEISSNCIGNCNRCACLAKDDIDTDSCNWCDKNLTVDEQEAYNNDSGNWVFDGEDKIATCDICMRTLCEKCDGKCEHSCGKCGGVCEAYLCDVNINADGELIKECVCTGNSPFEITLSNLTNYSKKRLQDENVKYGLARCDNEKKDKTIAKLTNHLEKLSKYKTCMLKLDDDAPGEYAYPQGKTRLDLNKLLHDFFTQ